MEIRQTYRVVFLTAIVLCWLHLGQGDALADKKLDPSLLQIEQRLKKKLKRVLRSLIRLHTCGQLENGRCEPYLPDR